MKRALLLNLVVALSATVVFAQGGMVGVFQDIGGADCNLVDGGVPTTTWHVVHNNVVGATAVQFKATLPAAFAGLWLSDQAVFGVTVGNSQTGVAVGYGSCLGGPIHVLSIVTFGGGTPACTPYTVTDDPNTGTGTIDVVDCANQLVVALPHPGNAINTNAGCLCTAVPVEESTWGSIKSLYSGAE